MSSRLYELVYIVDPNATDAEVDEIQAQIEATISRLEGRLDKIEKWGRRRLAYEIAHHKEGTYVLDVIEGSGELMRELDRRLKVFDRVIRHLVVRVDEQNQKLERQRAERAAQVQKRRRARGLPDEPEPAGVAPAGDPSAGEVEDIPS